MPPACSAPAPEALEDAQHHQQDRRQQPDLTVGRQQADDEGGDAHQQQGRHQDPFAAESVTEVGEDQSAEWARGETHRIRAERCDEADSGRDVGKEDLVEHQRCGGAVDDEVVLLESGADESGPRRSAV